MKIGGALSSTLRQGFAVNRFLQEPKEGVREADAGDDGGDVPVAKFNGEAIADEQPNPGEEMAAFPHAAAHSGFLSGEGGAAGCDIAGGS